MLNANETPGTQTAAAISVRGKREMPNNGEVGCVHYWIVDEARGPTSHGRCKNCGARATFPNVAPTHDWQAQQKVKYSVERC